MSNSNLPEGKIAVMLTQEQLAFLIENADTNVDHLRGKVLELAVRADAIEYKSLILKLDALQAKFRDVLIPLKEAGYE